MKRLVVMWAFVSLISRIAGTANMAEVTTLAGRSVASDASTNDGSGTQARLYPNSLHTQQPAGGAEVVLFTDRIDSMVRRVDSTSGEVSTLGPALPASAGSQSAPTNIKIDAAGHTAFIVDGGLHSISRMDLAAGSPYQAQKWVGAYSSTVGEDDGLGTNAGFNKILALDFSPDGSRLIVLERKYPYATPEDGVWAKLRAVNVTDGAVSTIGVVKGVEGFLRLPLQSPVGMAVAPDGNSVFITEGQGHRIVQANISESRKPLQSICWTGCRYQSTEDSFCAAGCFITATLLAGSTTGSSGHADGSGTSALFNLPVSLDVSPDRLSLLVGEGTMIRAVTIASGTVSTLAGQSSSGYTDGAANMSAFDRVLSAVFATRATKMYIAEHAGRIRVLDLLPPMPCPAGLTGPGDGRCTQCVAGTFKAVTGSTPCQPCQPGAYSATNASASCTLCVAGKFSTGWGSTGCNMCPALTDAPAGSETLTKCTCVAGYTGPDGGPCQACAENTYKATSGSATCVSCSSGSSSPAASAHISSCICNQGYSGPTGGICEACAAGKFKESPGSAVCSGCSAGKFSTGVAATSPSACLTCPPKSSSPPASASASSCACIPGFSGVNGGQCAACAAGKFKADPGSAACSDCPAGTFSTSVGAAGPSICSLCRAPLSSTPGSAYCECNAGYTGPPEGPCVACASGRFKESLGSAPCAPCAAGKYSALNASSACISCAGGKFLARTGAATADACEECAGDSHSQPGSDTATACVCNMGYTGPDGGPCTACAVNTYKDITGSASCSACASDRRCPAASTSADDCSPFRWQGQCGLDNQCTKAVTLPGGAVYHGGWVDGAKHGVVSVCNAGVSAQLACRCGGMQAFVCVYVCVNVCVCVCTCMNFCLRALDDLFMHS